MGGCSKNESKSVFRVPTAAQSTTIFTTNQVNSVVVSPRSNASAEYFSSSSSNSTTQNNSINAIEDKTEKSNVDNIVVNNSKNKNGNTNTRSGAGAIPSTCRQRQGSAKPARLIIEKDENIIDILITASLRSVQQLGAAR